MGVEDSGGEESLLDRLKVAQEKAATEESNDREKAGAKYGELSGEEEQQFNKKAEDLKRDIRIALCKKIDTISANESMSDGEKTREKTELLKEVYKVRQLVVIPDEKIKTAGSDEIHLSRLLSEYAEYLGNTSQSE